MLRLFVALDLPLDIKKSLLQLSRAYHGAHWQTEQQLHLTLVFMGEVDKGCIPELTEALQQIHAEPLTLSLKSVDYFGSNRYPRVLFADVEKNSALNKLQKQIFHALEELGLELEKRKYHPHITLARLDRTPYSCVADFLQAESLFQTGSFSIDQFHLFSSRQGKKGSEYCIEASFPLQSAEEF